VLRTRDVTLFYDDRVQAHCPAPDAQFLQGRLARRVQDILKGLPVKWTYPEHPGRLTAVLELLAREPVAGVHLLPGREASRAELGRVHTTSYLNKVFNLDGQNAWLDVDTTAVAPGSITAARVAAGTAITAVESVMAGETNSAFALVRPPGHHADSVRARGFCLFNNAAIAAAHAREVLGCERVLIIDIDAHHGNGTQEVFWADSDVMLIDLHRAAPFYPGSGALEEVGAGLGEGTTVNVPLPGDAGDAAYLKAFEEIIQPAAEWFSPELILVSTGFDNHALDLALNLSYEGMAHLTALLQKLATRHCPGRLVFILEGGYNLISLARGVHTVLEVLAGKEPPPLGQRGIEEVEKAAAYHRDAFLTTDT
jgi:acetoin utilization deacetylase AcuC-like enzyme